MSERSVVRVDHLPSHAYGARDPLWWGLMSMMAIEGTMVALLVAAHLYLRMNFDVWPPNRPTVSSLIAGSASVLLLVLSVPPMLALSRAARRSDLRASRRWLVLATVPSALFLVARVLELQFMPYRWDSHAHASLVWTLLGLHFTHGLLGVLEDLFFLALLYRGPVEKKHYVDLDLNAFYSFFVVAGALVSFAFVHLDPWLFGR